MVVTLLSMVHDFAIYEADRLSSLHFDVSRLNGLSFLLKEPNDSNVWRSSYKQDLVSSQVHKNVTRWSNSCLSAALAIQKCRQFLEELPSFELVSDHKPLILILNNYAMDKLDNPRLLRLRLKMQRYSYFTRNFFS